MNDCIGGISKQHSVYLLILIKLLYFKVNYKTMSQVHLPTCSVCSCATAIKEGNIAFEV